MDHKVLKLKDQFPQNTGNFLILNSSNIMYFTGFSGATALVVSRVGENILYVSETNFEQAKHEVKNVRVERVIRGESVFKKICQDVEISVKNRLAIDVISVEGWKFLVKIVGGEDNLVLSGDVVRGLRAVKTSDEVECIREACRIADVGISTAYEVVEPGVSEQEVIAEVEYAMRKQGSSGVAFDTIVVSGANCAFPHGACKRQIIKDGDLVVVDLGATVGNYRSDITRTVVAGKISSKQQEIFDVVKVAQDLAVKAVSEGVKAVDVDAVARSFIGRAGFRDYFVHNLGHGVGLDIHEAPMLSPDSKDILKEGNVVTVEPGVYIVGFGGIRIEDTICVTKHGYEKLTNSAYTLQTNQK
ncbi:MAG: Xaa-Pro peptidase family protein [Nitrososphaerota archaeon]|nr:Xaa-Pro peptidase family protein [Nitrososphaerota archaeon]